MHVSLPPPLKQWVEQQIQEHGYGTVSEYIRQLIRQEQLRQARAAVEAKLQEALDSGPAVPVSAQTWEESQQRVESRLQAGRRRRGEHGTRR